MARRVGQVVVAVVAIMAVAVLARPSQPDVPPPFTVERETASPEPVEPTPAPPDPEPPEADVDGADARRSRLRIHSLDPATFVPLSMPAEQILDGQDFVSSELSPDGRFLAVLHAGRAGQGATLRLYDTERLAVLRELEVPLSTGGLQFGADSGGLLWLSHTDDGGWELGGISLRGALDNVAFPPFRLPEDFELRELRPLREGRVAVAGYTAEATGGHGLLGPLRLLVAELAQHEIVVDVELPTVPARAFLDDADGLSEHDAGLAWDVEGERLHVVHADRDALFTVDLESGAVVDELAVDAGSLAARLRDVLVPPARAAGPREGRWRTVVATRGGDRLFVSGYGRQQQDASGDRPEGRWYELPLLVADLDAGSVRVVEEVRAPVVGVSPDGASVAVLGPVVIGEEPRVLRVLDGDTFEQRWEREVDHVAVSFTPDGRHLVLGDLGPRGGSGGHGLEVLDATDGASRQRIRLDGHIAGLHLESGLVVEVDWGR